MSQQVKNTSPLSEEDAVDPTRERWPLALSVSGTYTQAKSPISPMPSRLSTTELRLDVDGHYPQMTVSVSTKLALEPTHWIASLKTKDEVTYVGEVWYSTSPFLIGKKISLVVTKAPKMAGHLVPKHKVALTIGKGDPIVYEYARSSFHPLTLEYDYASDAAAYTTFDTGTHPNRPADLPIETLTMATVYRRAGFAVTESSDSGSVPIAEAGVGARWSVDEMHDSMEAHFSQYAATAKWAAWVFFASLSTDGTSLGGIMFDSEEAPTRQGCAIFVDSFIAEEPAGDPDGAAFVQRMRFWCACHELGHCMNLAHSWQKDYPGYGNSWVPPANDAESRSLMNYPFLVAGDSTAYFADHEYRFDDAELVFLRHAPYRFVEPGNAAWFINHGFEQLTTPGAPLELTVRANRDRPVYEFLECVVLELKLKNVSSGPRIVDEKIFARGGATIIIQKKGGPARQHVPYARPIYRPAPTVLAAGESLFDSAFVSAGVNGFDLSEPGDHLIRCAVVVDGMTIVSEPLRVRILPPKGYDEERVAQDFFSRDVGRVLAFDGSRVLNQGLDVLREVVEVLPTRRVARHAQVALGSNLSQDKKVLRVNPDRTKRVEVIKAAPEESRAHLSKALLGDSQEIASTLSHVDYGEYMHSLIDLLERSGDKSAMAEAVGQLRGCLDRIGAPERVKARAKR